MNKIEYSSPNSLNNKNRSDLYRHQPNLSHLLEKVLLLLKQKEDISLSIFENHVFIITKYANIQKIIPSIFIYSAHKLKFALIIITLLMMITKNSFKFSDKTFTDRLDIQLLTFPFLHFLYALLFCIDLKALHKFFQIRIHSILPFLKRYS